ncbi:MAG: hypothetical protein H7145_19485 [Akkermansiaceae bacterium]|nr:hypothetical protein [Armatimonadota bacterium]
MRITNKLTIASVVLTFCMIGGFGCAREEPVAPAPPPAAPAAPATNTAADTESQKVQTEDEAAAKRAL